MHRMLPLPERLPRDPRPPGEQGEVLRAALLRAAGGAGDAPARHRRPHRVSSARRPASASATSRSAARRSARRISTSRTTPSFRSRSASRTSSTTRSTGSSASSAAARSAARVTRLQSKIFRNFARGFLSGDGFALLPLAAWGRLPGRPAHEKNTLRPGSPFSSLGSALITNRAGRSRYGRSPIVSGDFPVPTRRHGGPRSPGRRLTRLSRIAIEPHDSGQVISLQRPSCDAEPRRSRRLRRNARARTGIGTGHRSDRSPCLRPCTVAPTAGATATADTNAHPGSYRPGPLRIPGFTDC